MTVVLDSNAVVALALDTGHAPAINRSLREWQGAEEALHAPALFRYEIANALTRYIVAGAIELPDATAAWRRAVAMPITLHGLENGPAARHCPQPQAQECLRRRVRRPGPGAERGAVDARRATRP